MSTTKPYTLAGYAADRAHGDLDQDAMRATVEALDAHRAALRDLVRVVSHQLARGENEPGDFEAAWRRAVELTKEKP